jgi:hypothetical protein
MYPWNNETSYEFRIHALQQMVLRHISRDDVVEIISSGEIIESYPDDMPYPSCLITGLVKKRILHVVISYAPTPNVIFIITAYEPDSMRWTKNYRRRQ